jgi:hypothetical protein
VELRCDLNAGLNIVEQLANLLGRKGFAAFGNSVALNANTTAQAGQVARDPVVGPAAPTIPYSI